ncbi:MAG: helix-turn-helix domain-containing protein [Candidatus Gastranaerophilales bacterium]|nr:helix-turn-helix domain-containing protein [Candidatus Gastranaerophilales bacterium]
MKNEKNIIGQRMQDYRKSVKKSVAEFAEMLEIKERTLGSYERGETTPSIEFIINFVNKFNISTDWLLLGIGTPRRIDDVMENFKCRYALSDKKIESLNELLENPAMLNALFLFISTLKGDKDALKVLEMINESPSTLNVMYGGN